MEKICRKKKMTRWECQEALKKAEISDNPNRKEIRMYACEYSKHKKHEVYHLTSHLSINVPEKTDLRFRKKWRKLIQYDES